MIYLLLNEETNNNKKNALQLRNTFYILLKKQLTLGQFMMKLVNEWKKSSHFLFQTDVLAPVVFKPFNLRGAFM